MLIALESSFRDPKKGLIEAPVQWLNRINSTRFKALDFPGSTFP